MKNRHEKYASACKDLRAKLPRMTKITIPTGTHSRITIPTQVAKPDCKGTERIGFSIDETAESLGISVPIVRSLVKDKTIRTVRVGKRVIVSVRSLREFVDGKTGKTDKTHVGK